MKKYMTRVAPKQFINVSDWVAEPQDIIFSQINDFIIAPVAQYFNADPAMNYFSMRSKKAYNKLELRSLIVHKLNYFEKFYDEDKELLAVYAKIKSIIDTFPEYNEEALFYDLKKYIINAPVLSLKMDRMNEENFMPVKIKFNGKDKVLYYDNNHIFIMMRISLTMTLLIPLLTHFAYKKKISMVDQFLLNIFSYVILSYKDTVDLYSKITETCSTNISNNKRFNSIWNNQDIRAIDPCTLTLYAVNNIILNIMPKYVYNDNPVNFNYASIGKVIKFKVTDAGYDFSYSALSSSQRDEDCNSDMDRYEAYLTKADEALSIQNKVNGEDIMRKLKMQYGGFSEEEIAYYRKRLLADNKSLIQEFQKELLYNLFFKYFGDTASTKVINEKDYVILLLIAKKICMQAKMITLPYVFSSRVTRYVRKTKLNKKEKDKLISSPFFKLLQEKYRTKKAEEKVEAWAATILASEFEIIEYTTGDPDKSPDGIPLPKIPDAILEEINKFALWVS